MTHVGRALYQVAHIDGWHSPTQVEGPEPTGGCVRVVNREETLGAEPEELPAELFDDSSELLYEQVDVFPP